MVLRYRGSMPLLSSEASESQLRVIWVVDAPPADVWACLTSPPLLAQWLGNATAGEIAPGKSVTVDHGDGYLCESTVLEHVPRRALTYTWSFPDEPGSVVSWDLSCDDRVTSVRLAHTDIANMVASYRDGWITHLTFLEAAALGTPMPKAMFWQVHATIALLNDRD